jgi:hypothetical protein
VLRANPATGPRPFTVFFPDGGQLFSGAVRLDIRVGGLIVNVAGEAVAVELDEAEFDLVRGHEVPVEAIDGIGGVRGGLLRGAGADNVLALAALPPERTAEIADVNVEMATRWRDAARELLRR